MVYAGMFIFCLSFVSIWFIPFKALADYNVSVHERCFHETKLVQDNQGHYTVEIDKEETCESTPNDWK